MFFWFVFRVFSKKTLKNRLTIKRKIPRISFQVWFLASTRIAVELVQ